MRAQKERPDSCESGLSVFWPWVVANRGATGRSILIVAGDTRSPQTTWREPAPGPASPWRELAPRRPSSRNHRGSHHCNHCGHHCSHRCTSCGNASGSSGYESSGCGNGYDGSCCGSHHCSCDHRCNHCSSSRNRRDDRRPRPSSHRPRGRFQPARKRSRHREQQYDSSSNPPINLQVP